jgi:hypothetical protein
MAATIRRRSSTRSAGGRVAMSCSLISPDLSRWSKRLHPGSHGRRPYAALRAAGLRGRLPIWLVSSPPPHTAF